MAVIDMDQASEGTPQVHPRQSRWLIYSLAVVTLASLALLAARPRTTPPVPAPPPVVSSVQFVVTGDGRATYAGVARNGHAEQVSSVGTAQVTHPATVVLTVRADAGARVSCQIVVNGSPASRPETAADGGSATCVWSAS